MRDIKFYKSKSDFIRGTEWSSRKIGSKILEDCKRRLENVMQNKHFQFQRDGQIMKEI